MCSTKTSEHLTICSKHISRTRRLGTNSSLTGLGERSSLGKRAELAEELVVVHFLSSLWREQVPHASKPGDERFLFALCLKAYIQRKPKNRRLRRSLTPSSFRGHRKTTIVTNFLDIDTCFDFKKIDSTCSYRMSLRRFLKKLYSSF